MLVTIAAVIVLAVVALNLVLHTELHNRIMAKALAGMIDGTARCGDIRLRLSKWPELSVEIDSISLTYPHDRFASYTRRFVPGTGPESDTMAVMAGIRVVSDYRDLKEGRITGTVDVRGLQAYALRFSPDASNLDIFHFPSSDKDTASSVLPYIKADVRLGDSRLAYMDRTSGLMLYGRLPSLDASGLLSADHTRIDVDLDAERLMFHSEGLGLLFKGLALNAAVDDSDVGTAAPVPSVRRRAGADVRRMIPEFLREESFRDADVNVHLDESISQLAAHWHPKATLGLSEGYLLTKAVPLRNSVRNARLRMDSNALEIDTLTAYCGSSDLALSGKVEGLARTLFGNGNGVWRADLDINAGRLNVNEFLASLRVPHEEIQTVEAEMMMDEEAIAQVAIDSLEDVTSLTKPKLIVVPANVLATARLNAETVNFDQFDISPLSADLSMMGRCIRIGSLKASSNKGNINNLEAYYSTRTKENIGAGFDVEIDSVSADRVRDIFPQLSQAAAPLRTFTGDFRCNAAATVKLDTNMNVLLPTMEGTVSLHADGLTIPELGDYKKYAKLLMFKKLNDVKLHDLDISGTISNNSIEVYPFLLEADRYSFALCGEQKLPSEFNYRATIIRSPLLIRVGGRVFGKNYKRLRFRLCKPQFKNTDVPVFYEEVDTLYRKVCSAVQSQSVLPGSQLFRSMDTAKRMKHYSTEVEDLPEDMKRVFRMPVIAADSCKFSPFVPNPSAYQGTVRRNASGSRP